MTRSGASASAAQPGSLRGRLLRRLALSLTVVSVASSGFILWHSWDEITHAYRDQVAHLAYTIAAVLDGGELTPQRAVETL